MRYWKWLDGVEYPPNRIDILTTLKNLKFGDCYKATIICLFQFYCLLYKKLILNLGRFISFYANRTVWIIAMQTGNGRVREYKILLGVISVLVGLASFYALSVISYGILKGLVVGLIVSLLYPICAALTVKIVYRFFKLALIWDKDYFWNLEYQILIGAFWPITLPISFAMGFYSLIINRLFPDH